MANLYSLSITEPDGTTFLHYGRATANVMSEHWEPLLKDAPDGSTLSIKLVSRTESEPEMCSMDHAQGWGRVPADKQHPVSECPKAEYRTPDVSRESLGLKVRIHCDPNDPAMRGTNNETVNGMVGTIISVHLAAETDYPFVVRVSERKGADGWAYISHENYLFTSSELEVL